MNDEPDDTLKPSQHGARGHAGHKTQHRAAGGIKLAPADTPAIGNSAGDRTRQAATGRRAQFRFHPQGIDQRPTLHGSLRQADAETTDVHLHAVTLQQAAMELGGINFGAGFFGGQQLDVGVDFPPNQFAGPR